MSEQEVVASEATVDQLGASGSPKQKRKPFSVMHHASAGGAATTVDTFDTFEEAEKDLLERVKSRALTGSVSIYGPDHKGRNRLLYQECVQGYGSKAGNSVLPWNPVEVAARLRAEHGWSEERVQRWLEAQREVSPFSPRPQKVEEESVEATPEPTPPPSAAAPAPASKSPVPSPEITLPDPYETLLRWWNWAHAVREVLRAFKRDEREVRRKRAVFLKDVFRRALTHGKVLPVDVVAAQGGRRR